MNPTDEIVLQSSPARPEELERLSSNGGAPQKRALFFVFDGGTGIGHLRRLSRIAKQLQGRFSCLIVTGHRAAAHWFVPEECEYVRLPSWDSLLESKARYWGRKPFISLNEKEAVELRRRMIRGVVEAFSPDVIFVDHLPLGFHEELAETIKNTRCKKYLITRGVLNETEDLSKLILGGTANEYLNTYYDKILVTSDRRVFDFTRQYNVSTLVNKVHHTGYVAESVPQDIIERTRRDRGLSSKDVWVVASAGGGQLGEELIESCRRLAGAYPNIAFDVVLGPRSRLAWEEKHTSLIARDNLRLHKEVAHMSYLYASADIAISSGGYNSLLEILQGRAKILCFPLRKNQRDEQFRHAACLKNFADIQVSTSVSALPELFANALGSLARSEGHDRRGELDFAGAAQIEKIVLADLALAESPLDAEMVPHGRRGQDSRFEPARPHTELGESS